MEGTSTGRIDPPPPSYSEHVQLEQVAQDLIPIGFKYLQGWLERFRATVQVFDQPHGKFFGNCIVLDFPILQLVSIGFSSIVYIWEEPGSNFPAFNSNKQQQSFQLAFSSGWRTCILSAPLLNHVLHTLAIMAATCWACASKPMSSLSWKASDCICYYNCYLPSVR